VRYPEGAQSVLAHQARDAMLATSLASFAKIKEDTRRASVETLCRVLDLMNWYVVRTRLDSIRVDICCPPKFGC
jgi:hypothetical protein